MILQENPLKFSSFMLYARSFYLAIGIEPYAKPTGGDRTRLAYLLDLWALCNLVNMNFVLIGEIMFVVLAFSRGENFVEATMNLSYIGFVTVGGIKIGSIWFQKQKLSALVRDLLAIYPLEVSRQRIYTAGAFLRRYNIISAIFATSNMLLAWMYNLHAVMSYLIYDYWLHIYTVPLALPYHAWTPFEWRGHWSYYPTYASQVLAGHTCMSGQIGCDLLLCVIATQLIMHYQYLARQIAAYVVEDTEQDKRFLQDIIDYHQKILTLSETMNDVFGVSLLVNFLSSSFIMCFLGFQLTIGVKTDALVMLLLFLFCSLMQVYMISNYGQQLIQASGSIGDAIYTHNWLSADTRYKKMLVQIIQRAQNPARIKATSFLPISMGTMTDLLQLSYKFFAVLRTIYSK